jgi:filamin
MILYLKISFRFVGEGHYGVDYVPSEVGDHQVEVKMSDLHVQGSPFIVKAYDATKVSSLHHYWL